MDRASSQQTRSTNSSLSHLQRTSAEPRAQKVHIATVSKVTTVNARIKTFRFSLDKDGLHFLPGQWLDVFVPNVEKAGGFTITSAPREALAQSDPSCAPYFELAIQQSPENPSVAWLWQPEEDLLGKQVKVRVGGSFVWPPPPRIDVQQIKRVVFIAGGVGINPLMSMLSHIKQNDLGLEVRLLYSTKVPSRKSDPKEILYLPVLFDRFRIPRSDTQRDRLELFLTGYRDEPDVGTANDGFVDALLKSWITARIESETEVAMTAWRHRIDSIGLSSAVGSQEEAQSSVFYVCGPPAMADAVVQSLQEQQHVVPERVLCEKWW